MSLYEGPQLVPALIGLFAISEVFATVESVAENKKTQHRIKGLFPPKEDLKKGMPIALMGGTIGTFIGILPGVGGDIGAYVSYSLAKRFSTHPEKYGTGIVEGVAATESANNGVTGGAMIPLLSLGVPGDSVTAVMLGAFTVQGLQAGPLLYQNQLDLVYKIFASLFVANIAMLIIGIVFRNAFVSIIGAKKYYLTPIILMLTLVGSYSMRNSVADVVLAVSFGVIGYLMNKFDFPTAPILLALILGPMAEKNLRRTLVIFDGSLSCLFTRPICIGLLLVAVLSVVASTISEIRIRKKVALANNKQIETNN